MIGAIIGDIVGSKYEFNNTFDYNFKLFDKGCNFTDDTICTIAIADAIVQARDGKPIASDFRYSLLKWCRRYPHPMGGYGSSFSKWLACKHPQPYNSFGNGAAMRVSPVGFAYSITPTTIREAMESAKVSHNHMEGLIGASVVALAISKMINIRNLRDDSIKPKAILYDIIEEYYGFNWEMNIPPKGMFDETCQGCVPLAFKICIESNSFEDAIRRAISYGGDSDTLGAIVGGLAQAAYGVPIELKQMALSYLPLEMIEVYNKFEEKYGCRYERFN